MKLKLFSSLALVAMMFAGTSCSSEEVAPVTGESTVTLSINLPDGIQSRAFGDGSTAKSLNVMVLDQNNNMLPVFENNVHVLVTDIKMTKQLNLRLAAGKTYKVVCWAYSANSPFMFHTDPPYVYTDYEGVLTNDENLDAFYAAQDITVTGNMTETIKLYRPFAQLNIGTDDLAAAKAAGFELQTVSVKAPAYKRFNLLTGDVVNDAATVNFGENTLPQGETFPKDGYEYVAMNYLLMSADKQLVDIEFTMKAADGTTRTIPVTGVPVQRNYRTNIYGSLLTNSVNINVEIVPDFEKPDYEQVPQEAVKTTEEFLEAAKVDNAVVTVAPNAEIVLSGNHIGNNVTVIGSEGSVLKQEGEFGSDQHIFIYDAEGLTLKNITIDCGTTNYYSFGRCNNMKFDNCTIKGQLCLNGDGITFEGCKFVQTDNDMYNLWSYGGNNVVFNKCTFENVGKAINVYREGAQANVFLKQTFNNCEFKSNPVNKAALNIKTDGTQCWELEVNNCTLTNGMNVYQVDNATKAANQVKLTVDGTNISF